MLYQTRDLAPESEPAAAERPADGDADRSDTTQLDEARRQLALIEADGEAQEAVRARMVEFMDRHPDCLHRRCLSGHLTGSAVVVDPGSGRTLLLHHAKLDRWLQPGGHADGEGDLGGVAWREATEETGLADLTLVTPGIDLDVHEIPARGDEPAHLHLDVRYLVLATGDLSPSLNHESHDARWTDPGHPDIAGVHELDRAVSRAVSIAALLTGRS